MMMIITNLENIRIPDSELLDIFLKKTLPPANLKNSVLLKILKFCDVKLNIDDNFDEKKKFVCHFLQHQFF